tara:strand:+ start:1518 stop:1784 length:267 start_codon:yes stop_codon:yes gene_type:complete
VSEKEMIDEMRKIEKILSENQKAEAPGLPKDPSESLPDAEIDINAQAIQEAENQSKDVTNQLATVNANLEALLTEVQGLATTIQQLTS